MANPEHYKFLLAIIMKEIADILLPLLKKIDKQVTTQNSFLLNFIELLNNNLH